MVYGDAQNKDNVQISKRTQKTYEIIEYIGIAADEPKRIRDGCYPLVEWDMTEKDCLEYCYKHGFRWDGLYEIFKRVSCWCCPLQSLSELRKLHKFFPDLWKQLEDWDNRTWRKFRADYSIAELNVRFDFEDECLKDGKSIRNRSFYNELKRRLGSGKEVDQWLI